MRTSGWILDVEYPSHLWLLSIYPDRDIEKLVGRERVSSGVGCGRRDIQFEFKTKKAATAAAQRLTRHFKDVRHVTVDVEKYP